MEIFAQEFEPASYFCYWTCVDLGTGKSFSEALIYFSINPKYSIAL